MQNEILKVPQASVAQALAADYFCIYYVNIDTDEFTEYSSSPDYRALNLPRASEDFVPFSRNNFAHVIHPDDREMFLEGFTKERVLASLDAHQTYTITFRMMFGEKPEYVHLKATRMIEETGHHMVIGISSIDEQVKTQEAFERIHQDSVAYSRIAQALAGDYICIYIVDPDTDRFVEYSATKDYEKLGVEKAGEDFFNTSRRNMNRLVYPEDRDRFMGTFTKEKVMSILDRDGSFTMKYRLMFDGVPVYISLKASLFEDEHGRHLVIGTNNIDAQMKREETYRQHMAEARTSARNDFLANMSHDIRTPMNAIVGYTNIAKSQRDNPEAMIDAIEKIGSSSHFMLSLINDILDISKIESGKMQLSLGRCNLADVFERIQNITSLQAANKHLKVTYQHDSVKHLRVIADELRIEQVFVNITSNAIKYTPENGEVSLVAEEEPLPGTGRNKYRFIVSDTGIGISEEYLPHLFESFTREEKTTVNRVQGTGLGLAITARVVELMGGTIAVESKVGEGSTFTVELELESQVEEDLHEAAEAAAANLEGRRVLLVEDNAINAEIATMVLQTHGLNVDVAENGQVGFEKVREAGAERNGEGLYDAVLMDIQMPVMNGYEATRAIRSLEGERFQALPIIAMSANAYDEDVRDCLDAGMDAHVAKPFNVDELLALLARHMAN